MKSGDWVPQVPLAWQSNDSTDDVLVALCSASVLCCSMQLADVISVLRVIVEALFWLYHCLSIVGLVVLES